MPENNKIKTRGDKVLVGNYARYPVTMVKGSGCRLTDRNGDVYLDFLSGIAVCSLGHCHPKVTAAIKEQAENLVHVSNLYYTEPQIRLAEMLCANSFGDKVFFCNSGAEANEAAIKLARIHSGAKRYKVISLDGSFHGRTLATVAATGQPKFHEGFEPLPEGFVHAPFGDLQALEALIDETCCAILCEPIQGESGIRPLPAEYLVGIRELCDRYGLLLILDEIQTGMGRTGSLYAHQQLGIVPDIITMAKALGGGLPIGAMMTTNEIAASLVPGTHASTFGGNPVACAAGVVVLEQLLAPDFLPAVVEKGQYFKDRLEEMVARFPEILQSVRGRGLLVGAVLSKEAIPQGAEIVAKMLEQGVLLNFAGGTVLRFAPPLIATEADIDEAVAALAVVLEGVAL